MKFAHNWKTHFLSHASNEEKPHKCNLCAKGFVTAPQLKKHMKQHEKQVIKKEEPKFHATQHPHVIFTGQRQEQPQQRTGFKQEF